MRLFDAKEKRRRGIAGAVGLGAQLSGRPSGIGESMAVRLKYCMPSSHLRRGRDANSYGRRRVRELPSRCPVRRCDRSIAARSEGFGDLGSRMMRRHVDHVDLRVRSLAEARFFYAVLLPALG